MLVPSAELLPSAEALPPKSNEPGCQPLSTEPAMLTASAGTEPEDVPTTRSLALMSMAAASPPFDAAVSTWPSALSAVVTAIDKDPASAGRVGRGARAAVAAALKKFDARLTS